MVILPASHAKLFSKYTRNTQKHTINEREFCIRYSTRPHKQMILALKQQNSPTTQQQDYRSYLIGRPNVPPGPLRKHEGFANAH